MPLLNLDFATKKIRSLDLPEANGAIIEKTDIEPDDIKSFKKLFVRISQKYGKGPYPDLIFITGEAHSGIQPARVEEYVIRAKREGLLPQKMPVHIIQGEGSESKDFPTLGTDVLEAEVIARIRQEQRLLP